ncbi:MAG: hypothetical protein JWP44_3407 [Mucilaginibacter sp.]|nr:hypothetical protein [Mucilaginibacter sp.]
MPAGQNLGYWENAYFIRIKSQDTRIKIDEVKKVGNKQLDIKMQEQKSR